MASGRRPPRRKSNTWLQIALGIVVFIVVAAVGYAEAGLNPVRIGDFAWIDLNANGIQEVGEPGLAGVTVSLFDSTNTLLTTTVTGATGNYQFVFLPDAPDTYTVEFEAPLGFSFTLQDLGSDDFTDSDANPTTGRTGPYVLALEVTNNTVDAGFIVVPEPTTLALFFTALAGMVVWWCRGFRRAMGSART